MLLVLFIITLIGLAVISKLGLTQDVAEAYIVGSGVAAIALFLYDFIGQLLGWWAVIYY